MDRFFLFLLGIVKTKTMMVQFKTEEEEDSEEETKMTPGNEFECLKSKTRK